MRTYGNPTLRRVVRNTENGKFQIENDAATKGGIAWKSVAMCLLTVAAAIVSVLLLNNALYSLGEGDTGKLTVLLISLVVTGIPMIGISLVITFVPSTAAVLGLIYCVLQGFMLGVTVGFVDLFAPGIAFAAFLGTALVFVTTAIVYRLGFKRISGKVAKFFAVALISFVAVELVLLIICAFVPSLNLFTTLLWIQLLVSALTIFWASYMLVMDFSAIDRLVSYGADKKYEWLAAFSLTTTLVWLYLEILEFLVRIVALFGRSK